MLCPSCGYDNIDGADRCEECVTSLLKIDPEAEQEGMASSVMENDISQLEQEFLGVSPETSALEVGVVIAEMIEESLDRVQFVAAD